jgi:hypothetical protein
LVNRVFLLVSLWYDKREGRDGSTSHLLHILPIERSVLQE